MDEQFELDFCTALRMFEGLEYDEAVEQAHKDFHNVREEEVKQQTDHPCFQRGNHT